MERVRAYYAAIPRREKLMLAGAMLLGFACVALYVLSNRYHPLIGDMPEYDLQGRLFTEGKAWWSTTPFGVEHPTAWKAPGYPLWVGFWYSLLGVNATRIELVQAFLSPLTVLVVWMLARRLFTPRVAIASAFVVALFPLAWEYYGLLYPEALAVPLTALALLLFLGREPSVGRSAAVGAVIGACMLVRPTSGFLFAGVAAAWIVAAGWRRGATLTAVSVVVAALAIAPWTIRNVVESDGGFIPISVQDAAAYGTFNDVAANDPVHPYRWRPQVFGEGETDFTDGEDLADEARLRSEFQSLAVDYVKEHPGAVAEAFFWNGLSRFWDVRRPAHAMDEVGFEGRSDAITAIGLAAYYVLLPLAIFALWRLRRRRELLYPVLAMALAASIVFTVASGTRYRAPLEPLIVILACSLLATAVPRPGSGRAPDEEPGVRHPAPQQ
jgi:4-amino-4-deoxy-L-arabinose transferase-like glycosyltransferase